MLAYLSLSFIGFGKFFIEALHNRDKNIGDIKIISTSNFSLLYFGLMYFVYAISMFFFDFYDLGAHYLFPQLVKLTTEDITFIRYVISNFAILTLSLMSRSVYSTLFKNFCKQPPMIALKIIIFFIFVVMGINIIFDTKYLYEFSSIFWILNILFFFFYSYVNKNNSISSEFPTYFKVGVILFLVFGFGNTILILTNFIPDAPYHELIDFFAFCLDKIGNVGYAVLCLIMLERNYGKVRIKYGRDN
jgi:hypothetical protein